jgi:hypothetical protein
MTPVERFLSKLPNVRRTANGWSAQCPAHDDRRASLSIAEGNEGGALVICHAGCNPAAVVAAVGLTLADLMPPKSVKVNGTHPTTTRTGFPLRREKQPAIQTFATAHDAVAELERQRGPRSAWWTYHDADGELVGVVNRWNMADGKKDIRPVSRVGDSWRIGGMPEPRPLYRLPDLSQAKCVYVCEGEKAAEAARAIGLTATTSAHGSQSPDKTDWSPLTGKEIVIFPDNDCAGQKYADAVTALLAKLTPAPVVKVVHLPDLPDAGDIVDWTEQHGDAAEPEELRRKIEALVKAAERVDTGRPSTGIERFEAFPVDVLPGIVGQFVREASTAIGCDESYVAVPLLAALASAIGNTRRVRLKRSWSEPAVVWAVIVGESGSQKSPAWEAATRPLLHRQTAAFRAYSDALPNHAQEVERHKAALQQWRHTGIKKGEPPPDVPVEPVVHRYTVSDITVEALAPILDAQPRGVLLSRDELAGWLGSFDRYANGKGADAANWLSMHRAGPVTVDRKTGKRLIHVPHAAVSVAGSIQPMTLRAALGREHFEDGLAARLLLASPPRRVKRWTEADVPDDTTARLDALFGRLLELDFALSPEGEPEPYLIPLAPDAKTIWIAFYGEHAAEAAELADDLAAAWSKIEGYCARLALIITLARNPTATKVDAESMQAGIILARWFAREARRVYAALGETDEERDHRRLIELIERRGGSISPRELTQSDRRFRGRAEAAELELSALVEAGLGTWEDIRPGKSGGRPTRRFHLAASSTDVDGRDSNDAETEWTF